MLDVASLAAFLRIGSPAMFRGWTFERAAGITEDFSAFAAVVLGLLAGKPVPALVASAKKEFPESTFIFLKKTSLLVAV